MPDGVVTALTAAGEGRVGIELDGAPWLEVAGDDRVLLGLAVGDRLPPGQRAALESAAAEGRAVARGAALVARRSHARSELERRLARGEGAAAATRAAERLQELGVLDDRRHAAEVAEHRLAAGWGPARIRHDLEQAGVAPADVEEAIAAIAPEQLEAAARTALGARTGIEGWQRLARRGFDEETAERLLGLPDDAI